MANTQRTTSVPASTEPTLALVISREQAERLYWAVGHDADDYTRPIFEYLRDYLGHEYVLTEIYRMRKAGVDLPYRNRRPGDDQPAKDHHAD